MKPPTSMPGEPKTYRSRTIALPPSLRDMLNTHLIEHVTAGPEALVFTATGRMYKNRTVKPGTPLRHSNFAKRIWRPAIEAAGVPPGLRIHDLRHTAVALMIAAGAHPEHIKRHLGHSSITVTMDLYGHLFPSEADTIAERLDQMLRDSRTDKRRTKPLELTSWSGHEPPGQAPDQGIFGWARQGSNLRPTDYESVSARHASLGKRLEMCSEQVFRVFTSSHHLAAVFTKTRPERVLDDETCRRPPMLDLVRNTRTAVHVITVEEDEPSRSNHGLRIPLTAIDDQMVSGDQRRRHGRNPGQVRSARERYLSSSSRYPYVCGRTILTRGISNVEPHRHLRSPP